MATDQIQGFRLTPRWAAAGAALLVVIGSFAPWAKLGAAFTSFTIDGTDGPAEGTITLALALFALLVIAVIDRGPSWLPLLPLPAGMACLAFALYDVTKFEHRFTLVHDEARRSGTGIVPQTNLGFGLWLTLIGAVVLTATGGVLFYRFSRMWRDSPSTVPIVSEAA